jgi:hypothetical protein
MNLEGDSDPSGSHPAYHQESSQKSTVPFSSQFLSNSTVPNCVPWYVHIDALKA